MTKKLIKRIIIIISFIIISAFSFITAFSISYNNKVRFAFNFDSFIGKSYDAIVKQFGQFDTFTLYKGAPENERGTGYIVKRNIFDSVNENTYNKICFIEFKDGVAVKIYFKLHG